MHRNDHGEIEGNFPIIEGHQPSTGPVNFTSIELGDELNIMLSEHATEPFGGDRLGERGVERSDVREFHVLSDPSLLEIPIGQETELKWRHWALDRHLDDVDHETSALECGQCPFERFCPFRCVKREDLLQPSRPG
jgi:hypothetical protein